MAMLAVAALLLARYVQDHRRLPDNAFFYDLSERKLFVAARTNIPPIRGLKGEEADGVRAVVISYSRPAADPAEQRIAYLEMYSPEFKRQAAEFRQPLPPRTHAGTNRPAEAPRSIGRLEAPMHTFVRRPDDTAWHQLGSPEGQAIVRDALAPGPDGRPPRICVP